MHHARRWGVALLVGGGFACAAGAPLNVCLVSGSFEYDSDTSLGLFKAYLEARYDVDVTLLSATGWTDLPGLEALDRCDVALFFTRRLRIGGKQLERVKGYCESGRPIVAVRTASHGFQAYLEFDHDVLGGNYQGHFGNGPTTNTAVYRPAKDHPILDGVMPIRSLYSLYRNSPIAEDAEPLVRRAVAAKAT